MSIILASQSPRRKELLSRMGLTFTVQVSEIDEDKHKHADPGGLVEALSLRKAVSVQKHSPDDAVIIAADTVVVLDKQVLGKPKSRDEAILMLSSLSGRTHEVFTGMTVMKGKRQVTTHEITSVRFRPLTLEEILCYVKTGEPMDKAGAYGIQGFGAMLVAAIQGDYFNVMGLPVCRLGQILPQFGIDPFALAAGQTQ